MGYSAETTHEGFPLPTGSDLTTPMDYNESLQKADTDIFNALTNSDTALQKAIGVETGLTDTNTEVTSVKGRVTTLEQTSQTQGTAITNLGNKVDDVKADALDMICAVDEGTAQIATVPVSEGDYFRYNDVLYMADDDIAIGDTIVPNTNCHATNVATELQNAGGGGSTVDSVARAGVQTNANAIGTLSELDTTDKSSLVAAINEVLSQIGGVRMRMVKSGNVTVQGQTNATVDLSSLGFTSREDFIVLLSGAGFTSNDSGGNSSSLTTCIIDESETNANQLSIKMRFGTNSNTCDVSYQIISLI